MFRYTNQAREYNSPVSHQGEGQPLGVDGGADLAYNTNNHRGWHPVIRETGRDPATRMADASNWIAPFNAAVGTQTGTQTMYCSDCHGSNTPPGTADPDGPGYENGAVWGPHGSTNNFLLKGAWNNGPWNGSASAPVPWTNATGFVQQGVFGTTKDHLCFKCHNWDDYANPANTSPGLSGFRDSQGISFVGCGYTPFDTSRVNLHIMHADIANDAANKGSGGFGSTFACSNCHIAVPHGWKNKAFLVNLNDVGPEVGLLTGTVINRYTDPDWEGNGYTNGPYYLNAKLYIINFKRSGEWTENDCGYQNFSGPFGMINACDVTP